MAGISLYPYQLDAVRRMRNGCILCGGVGSGKSRTALAYYYICNGGEFNAEEYQKMNDPPKDLYIITTARKRDTFEWDKELAVFLMATDPEIDIYQHKVVIDSWNNIKKYTEAKGAFFIFDEQRVVGSGAWVKAFYKITKANQWILLSATPGDTWMDYIPVFVANGFYKNKTEFCREHVVFRNYGNFYKPDRILGQGRLLRLRNNILIDMDFQRKTESHHKVIYVSYDTALYKSISRDRWDIWNDIPLENASDYCYALRRVVNSDESRVQTILDIFAEHPRIIIFYNFDYELKILREIDYGDDVEIAQWNGHKHQEIPQSKTWVYLVQYTAGAEGWNCITTDTIIFFSQNYSYKVMVQASGRIDRLNTPYTDLYYYHLKSRAGIDVAISRALKNKKKFNETGFFTRNLQSL